MQRPMQRMPDPMTVGSGPMGESPYLAIVRNQQSLNRGEQNAGTMDYQGAAAAQDFAKAQQSQMNTEGHRLNGAFLEATRNQLDLSNFDPRLAASLGGAKLRAMKILGLSSTNELEVLAGA